MCKSTLSKRHHLSFVMLPCLLSNKKTWFLFMRQSLTMQPGLAWNSLYLSGCLSNQRSPCLCFLSAKIKGNVQSCCETKLFFLNVLPSLTDCTKTGLSPLTVSPNPLSSFWMITQRWTRPAEQPHSKGRRKKKKRMKDNDYVLVMNYSLPGEIKGNS